MNSRALRKKASQIQLDEANASLERGGSASLMSAPEIPEIPEGDESDEEKGRNEQTPMVLPMRGPADRGGRKQSRRSSHVSSSHVSSRQSTRHRPDPAESSVASSRPDPSAGSSRSGGSSTARMEPEERRYLSWKDTQSQMRDTLEHGFTRFDKALKSARDTEVPRSRSSRNPNKAPERVSTAETLSRFHLAGGTLAKMQEDIQEQFETALEKLKVQEYNTAVSSAGMSRSHEAKNISEYHEKMVEWQNQAVRQTMKGLMSGPKDPLKSLFSTDNSLEPLCSFEYKDQWSNNGIFTAELVAVRNAKGREKSVEEILAEEMDVDSTSSAESDTDNE